MITAAPFAAAQAFRAKFSASLATTLAARTTAPAAATATKAVSSAEATLQARLKDALDKGIPPDRVIGALANQLATSIAAGLGPSGADAIARITSVVAQALAPPGPSPVPGTAPPKPAPPASNAELARHLAVKARQIVEVASRVGTGPPDPQSQTVQEVNGEASRRLAGNPSDTATTVRGNPAPGSTDSTRTASDTAPAGATIVAPAVDSSAVLRDAATLVATLPTANLVAATAATSAFASTIVSATPVAATLARAVPASVTAPAAAAYAPPAVAAVPAGDGKRVTVDPATLVASGGDTLLGRVLTRAVRSTSEPVAAPAAPAPVLKAATPAASDTVTAFVARFAEALGTPVPAGGQGSSNSTGTPADSADADRSPSAPAASDRPLFAALLAPAAPDARPAAPAIAPSTLPALAPATDPGTIVDQLVGGAFGRIKADGSSEMRLQLHPADLGDLSVKLVVSGGNVSATVIASTAQAHDALLGAQSQLHRSLADAGLKLASFTVAHDGGNATSHHESPSQQRSSSDARRHVLFGFESVEGSDDDASVAAVPTFGPPLAGGLIGGLGHNHLV